MHTYIYTSIDHISMYSHATSVFYIATLLLLYISYSTLPMPIYTYYTIVQVQVFTQRPRNGRIKLCNCANREIQLSKLCRIRLYNTRAYICIHS